MDFPRPSVSPGNLIGDLKDRFGFGGGKQQHNYDEEPYYDDYDNYGYDDNNPYDSEDMYATQADPYDRLEYTTRSAASRSSRASGYGSSPHLVSSSDIRATTSAYGVSAAATSSYASSSYGSSYTEGGYTDGGAGSLYDAGSSASEGVESEQYDVPATTYTDFVSPYKDHARQSGLSSSATGTTGIGASSAVSSGASRSAGLDSLFAPSTSQPTSNSGLQDTSLVDSGTSASGTSIAGLSREITLLQPVSYDDVASVARSVRLGNIVVLSLRSTDSALAKRVLDFSFGVASALDAKVDCVANKTFVIVQGRDLSLEERHRLQKQGIL